MAGDIFLELEGVTGESEDSKLSGKIQITSFSWGASQPASSSFGTGLSVGKVQMHDVSFTKQMDKASSVLFKAMCTGKHINKATFHFRKAGTGEDSPEVFLKITLNHVMPTGVTFADHAGGDLGAESWSMTYVKYHSDYKPAGNDGALGASVEGGWDVQANKAA